MKRKKTLIVLMILSGLMIIGYGFFKNINLYTRDVNEGMPDKYLTLFSEAFKKKIGKALTYSFNSNRTNEISICEVDHKYNMLIYKLYDSKHGLDSLYFESYDYNRYDFDFYNRIKLHNYSILFNPDPENIDSPHTYATYFKDSLTYYCRNDSIIVGQGNYSQFSAKRSVNGEPDIKLDLHNWYFINRSRSVVFSYIKKDGSVYLILMTSIDDKDPVSSELIYKALVNH